MENEDGLGSKELRPAHAVRLVVAANLRALRRAKDLSQEELAERAGLSRAYLSSVERRLRGISIDNVGRLADALGVAPTMLLDPELMSRLRGDRA